MVNLASSAENSCSIGVSPYRAEHGCARLARNEYGEESRRGLSRGEIWPRRPRCSWSIGVVRHRAEHGVRVTHGTKDIGKACPIVGGNLSHCRLPRLGQTTDTSGREQSVWTLASMARWLSWLASGDAVRDQGNSPAGTGSSWRPTRAGCHDSRAVLVCALGARPAPIGGC